MLEKEMREVPSKERTSAHQNTISSHHDKIGALLALCAALVPLFFPPLALLAVPLVIASAFFWFKSGHHVKRAAKYEKEAAQENDQKIKSLQADITRMETRTRDRATYWQSLVGHQAHNSHHRARNF